MSGPAPAVAAARRAVRADLADLVAGDLVLVACSGGPDSLALAAATAFVAPRAGLRAGAVVVDHGLQAGSAAVADDAGAACRRLGLDPVRVVRVTVGAAGGPEGAARHARYAALEDAAADLGAVAVLLGHTLDDQAETVLLGLARGSGARSLAGMPARRGVLRRPLLALRRTDTLAVCAALALEPWHDPTNAGRDLIAVVGPDEPGEPAPAPRRSAVRRHVLPMLEGVLGPGVAVALARTADQLREDADALDALAADLLDQARSVTGPTPTSRAVVLDVGPLAAAPAALRRRALRAAALEAGCPAGALHRAHVVALDALVTSWHGQGPVALPGRIEAARACGSLTFITPHD
ncbi:tRNA lysidine(34) synthetase TilS [Pengzhenrongella frigida]|uniref:tRNA(Ile)-lysidine synthase n=1 Tax=Pengzhenrongella frigida TaxID=1259133 RepID=A0A4Q5MWK0_9MICO|nr:tRNA lysidine(34) synthetase TilS [Cellulomonas sp. HLT2-17]RYV49978.1 tRNA lysidine(34) synthetase TilS [Cellulomonas sp. HLT2-17]